MKGQMPMASSNKFDPLHPDEWSFTITDVHRHCLSMMGNAKAVTSEHPFAITTEHEKPDDLSPLRGARMILSPSSVEWLRINVPYPIWTLYPQSTDVPSLAVKLTPDQVIQFTQCLTPNGPKRCHECVGCELNEQVPPS